MISLKTCIRRAATFFVAAGMVSLPCFADSLTIRYAGEMMHLPAGSDIVALGETGVVLPRHASASLWNPASPAFFRKHEFSAEFADLYQGMSQQGCLAVNIPFSNALGTSLMYMPFLSGPISINDTLPGTFEQRLSDQKLRADGSSDGTFSNNQHLIVVSVAKLFSFSLPRSSISGFPLPLDLAAGCSFKSYWQTMKPGGLLRMGMCFNLDAGLGLRIGLDYDLARKEVSRQILLGASLRDFLPSPVKWIHSRDEYNPSREYREDLTRSYYGGISYVDQSGQLGGTWTFSAAMEKIYRSTYHYGIEAEFWKFVAFRAGLSNRVPSLGVGLRWKRYFLDYAFRFDDLAWSYVRLTLGMQY